MFDEFTSSRCNATSFYNVLSVNIFSGGKPTDNAMEHSWALSIIYYMYRGKRAGTPRRHSSNLYENGRLALG